VAEMSWLRRIAGRTRRGRNRNEIIRKELEQEEILVDMLRKRRLTRFSQVVRIDDKRLPTKALHCQVEVEM